MRSALVFLLLMFFGLRVEAAPPNGYPKSFPYFEGGQPMTIPDLPIPPGFGEIKSRVGLRYEVATETILESMRSRLRDVSWRIETDIDAQQTMKLKGRFLS